MISNPLFPLIVAANFAVAVHARNETIIHGWVPEPQGRGTWSILWSCLVTISLCTWSAVYMSVPKTGKSYPLELRKMGRSLLAVIAPEVFLGLAADGFIDVWYAKRKLHSLGKTGWTTVHLHFGIDKGFDLKADGAQSRIRSLPELCEYITAGKVGNPPVTEEEIRARGEANTAVRLFAIVQIIWFVAQLIARASQRHRIISLEIFTASFVFCSVLTYALNFKRPQNVDYPVVLGIDEGHVSQTNVANDADENPGSISEGLMTTERPFAEPLPNARARQMRGKIPAPIIPKYAGAVSLSAFIFSACIYGGLHCLAWDSPTPTKQERLAWRVCSCSITVLPLFFAAGRYEGESKRHLRKPFAVMVLLYGAARLTLLALTLTSLRALPADVYETVDWSRYFPRFSN